MHYTLFTDKYLTNRAKENKVSDTNDPCQQERGDLAAIDQALAEARADAQQERDVLLGYQKIIGKGAPYSAADKNWIDDVVADSRSEQDAYKNAPDALDTIDNTRPLIGAAHHRSIELGKARDRIRGLLSKQKTAYKKLKDCEAQHQQGDQAQSGEQPQSGEQTQNGEQPADSGRVVCGQPRVGHGHEGEPCHVHLGPDGLCQYHDIA